jgi:hypothetical protein
MSLDAAVMESPRKPNRQPKARMLTLSSLDKRTSAAKRTHELIAGIATDLGGAEHLTEGAKQLVQRAAVLGAFIEDCEARWVAGEPFVVADYLPAINAQRRVLESLGLERRAKDVTPTLSAYLATKAAAPAVSAEPSPPSTHGGGSE